MNSAGSRLVSAVTGLWGPRVAWLAVGIAGAWSIGGALDSRSAAVRTVVALCAWLLWGVGVVALVVPSTLGLTVMRMVGALGCGAAILSWVSGAPPASGAVFVACTLIGGVLVGGAEFGQRCVQASAYGDEQRFLLRPPAPFLLPMAIAGLVWTAAVLAAPLLLASKQWISGGVVTVFAVLSTLFLFPRFHALSCRWFVLVPAGVVVHDHVVFAETMMVPRVELATVELALTGTEAADFTGPAMGHAIEVTMRVMSTIVLAPTKTAPRGTALHVKSFIVAPTRPGAVLRAHGG